MTLSIAQRDVLDLSITVDLLLQGGIRGPLLSIPLSGEWQRAVSPISINRRCIKGDLSRAVATRLQRG
jgi:hypothetical protein